MTWIVTFIRGTSDNVRVRIENRKVFFFKEQKLPLRKKKALKNILE